MAAAPDGPDLGAWKDPGVPAGPQDLHCGRAAVTLLCCISEHQRLQSQPYGSPDEGKHGAPYPAGLAVALANCFSENPTGKGEMSLLLDSFLQYSHHHGN